MAKKKKKGANILLKREKWENKIVQFKLCKVAINRGGVTVDMIVKYLYDTTHKR